MYRDFYSYRRDKEGDEVARSTSTRSLAEGDEEKSHAAVTKRTVLQPSNGALWPPDHTASAPFA